MMDPITVLVAAGAGSAMALGLLSIYVMVTSDIHDVDRMFTAFVFAATGFLVSLLTFLVAIVTRGS